MRADAVRNIGLQPAHRGEQPAGATRAASGPTSPTTSHVTVFGNQAESCAQYLSKGRPVAIDGRLDWREWETQDGRSARPSRSSPQSVQFLGSRGDDSAGGGGNQFVPAGASSGGDADFQGADDDIPF